MFKLMHYRFRGGPIKVFKSSDGIIPLFSNKQFAYEYSKGMWCVFPEDFKGKVTKKHKVVK